ncbi:MAG: adenosylcobinamide-GDP ribazoletransferase [Runella sp.]
MLRQQLHLFLTAVMFYTRIPCPSWIDHRPHYLNRATVYFPIIGWIVGGISAVIFWGTHFVFDTTIALILSIIASVWTTGAFHEDGFADVCDGFGGGWHKAQILDIMKDSRLGTYGAIGLGLLLALKYVCLSQISHYSADYLIVAFLIAHPLSRWVALTFIYTHTYVQDDQQSKAKPIAQKLSLPQLAIATFWGVAPLLLVSFWLKNAFLLLIFPVLWVIKWYLSRFFVRWIGGYTGDCLGATQQVAEVVIYLFLCGLWKLNG